MATTEDAPEHCRADSKRTAAPTVRQSVWMPALLGSLLMFAAQPPIDLWPLAWIAPIPWLLLVRRSQLAAARPKNAKSGEVDTQSTRGLRRLSPLRAWRAAGRGIPGYREVWAAGLVFWLLNVHWIRLPYPPATWLAWFALAFYLSFYIPLFIGLARVAVHRLGISIVLAAPVVWTGLELAQAHLLSGFLMGALSHSQYRWLALIQISDLVGAYGVSFVVMLVAACLARMWQGRRQRPAWWPALPAVAVVAATLAYGYWRLQNAAFTPGPTVALLQGAIPAEFKGDAERDQQIMDEHQAMTRQVTRSTDRRIDVVVWPETMCRQPLYEVDEDYQDPPDAQYPAARLDRASRAFLAELAIEAGVPLLLGLDAVHVRADGFDRYNSATLVSPDGEIAPRYDKMHRVMFGEYVPCADVVPLLYSVTPLTGGIGAGQAPVAYEIAGARLAPTICYETVIPHLITRQIRTLTAADQKPDVLVNLTNDAWFRGSSELDMHLACGVFRVVETRTPLVVAANGGLTAAVDGNGRVVASLPRQTAQPLVVDVQLDSRDSLYLTLGDWPAGLCLMACVGLAIVGWRRPNCPPYTR